jgi:copper chaperone
MSCSHCQRAVTNALKELEGVENVEVHLDQGTADVTYDSSKVSIDKMKEAVEEQGYDVV